MFTHKSSLNFKTGKIDIETSHNPKITTGSQLFIRFHTSEELLINELLKKFKAAKLFDVGANANNKIISMICNNSCIYTTVPEAKVFNIILQVYKYLLTMKISPAVIKTSICSKQSYNKLHSDIMKGFEVIITGKCKSLTDKLNSKDQDKRKQILKFIELMNAIEDKSIEDITPSKSAENCYKKYPITGSQTAKLYFAIMCVDFNFKFEGENLVTDECTYLSMVEFIKNYGDIARERIKTFISQTGSKATVPPANNKDAHDKVVARNNLNLYNLNIIIGIVSHLFNIPFKKLTMESWELDKDALTQMKGFIKQK